MRSYLIFTETGPILILTSCASVTEEPLLNWLRHKGVEKFIASEVPLASVHRLYGVPFEVVAGDIERGKPVRVLDFNGHHIFSSFSFAHLGAPIKVGE
ncbi:MAG: hypothetical protein C3F15_14790 [Holophagae bacterium]|nr:MAG: hypothetical protein C3F15_14790 [Holophagae bacterium]